MAYDVKIYSGNAVSKAKQVYALELSEIKDEKNRSNLASVLLNRDMNEGGNISLAYYLSKMSDKDAQQDGFKTAVSMIEKVTGLKKSMISNYRKVGAFLTSNDGIFELPEYANGFSVTQMVEILSKKTPTEFESMVNDGIIDNTMSAKQLRDICKPDSIIDVNATETETATATETATESATATEKATATETRRIHYLEDSNGNNVAIIELIQGVNGFDFAGIYALNDLRIGSIVE